MSQDVIISEELKQQFNNVLKFSSSRLARALATWVIKVKPLHVLAASQVHGQAAASAALSLLIVGPKCLARSSK